MSNQVSCSLCDVLSHGGHRVAAAELSDSMPICKGCQSLSVDEIIKLASKSYNSNVSRWALSFQQAVASAVAQGSLFIHAHFVQDESDSQVQNGLSLHDRSCFTSKVTGLLDDAFCHPLAVDRVFMMDAAIPLRPPRVWTAATASERRVTRVLFAAFMNQISERHNIRLGVVCADGRSAMAVWSLDWLTAVDIIPAGRLVHSFHPMWPPYQKGHIGVAAGLLGPGLGSFSIGQFECESQGERGATTLLQGMVAFFNSLRLEGTMLGRVSSLALLQYEPAAMEAVAEISRVGVDPFFLLDMRSVVRGILTKTSRAAKSGYKWVEIAKPSGKTKRLRCCVATFIDGDGKRHIDYYETVEEAALAVARSQRIHGSAKCGGDHHGKGKPAGRNSHTEMRIGFVGKKVRAPNK